MISLLLLVFVAGSAAQETKPTESRARFVDRRDLPSDLNLPFRENGFTVVAVTVVNKGTQAVKIDTAQIRVMDPKNKPIVAAASTEVTPKMVKSGARVPSVYAGARETPPLYGPGYGRPIDTGISTGGGGGGVVDIGRVERLKAAIEKYQLKNGDVLTGERAEGYLYLKTDKDPDQLKGTRILITEEITLAVE